jgi:hypothetical protein
MLASEIWAQINSNVRNFGALKEAEALYFMNWSVDYLNEFLIEIKDPQMSVDLSVTDGMTVPANYSKTAGTFPVHITNSGATRIFKHDVTNKPTIPIRYFARRERINAMSDTWPFDDSLSSVVMALASVYAINRAEGDTTNDMVILKDRLDRVKAASGI